MTSAPTTLVKSVTFAALPPVWPEELQARVQAAAQAADRTLVVVDDDPTGTQTVHGIPVVTRWNVETLRAELRRDFFEIGAVDLHLLGLGKFELVEIARHPAVGDVQEQNF